MIKLLMLNYEFPPIGGGGANANLQILRQFAENGEIDIDLVTSKPGRGDIIDHFAGNIRIHKLGIVKRDLHHWRKSEVIEWLFKVVPYHRRLVSEKRYDLVHAFFAFPSGFLPWMTRKSFPYVISLRGSDVPGYNTRLKLDYIILAPLFKSIYKNASQVIANSTGLAKLAGSFTSKVNIDVIPNGVDTDVFRPAENKDETLSPPYKLLSVARLTPRKRIDMQIRALQTLQTMGIDTTLTITGEGPQTEALKVLTEQLGLSEKVIFTGRKEPDELPCLYRRHHLFLMTSTHEGMSNAMLEAISTGLPVVTTPCEGVDELVTENTGIVIDPAAPEPLAEAIRSLLENPQRRKQMSLASRDHAKNFTWHNVADSYLEIYSKIMHQ